MWQYLADNMFLTPFFTRKYKQLFSFQTGTFPSSTDEQAPTGLQLGTGYRQEHVHGGLSS